MICRPVKNAQLWLDRLLEHLPQVQLTLLIGRYAQCHYLGTCCKPTLTETVAHGTNIYQILYLCRTRRDATMHGFAAIHGSNRRCYLPCAAAVESLK